MWRGFRARQQQQQQLDAPSKGVSSDGVSLKGPSKGDYSQPLSVLSWQADDPSESTIKNNMYNSVCAKNMHMGQIYAVPSIVFCQAMDKMKI